MGLRIASALQYVNETEITAAVGYLDEVLAILAKILGFIGKAKAKEKEKGEKLGGRVGAGAERGEAEDL